jgi:hypothetical protein
MAARLEGGSLIGHNYLEKFAGPHTYEIENSGTGRASIPIARLGIAVTGFDIVPGMVELARSKSADLPTRWVEGDARIRPRRAIPTDLFDRKRLPGILTRANQEALLERMRAQLHDEGRFAFETRNPRWNAVQTVLAMLQFCLLSVCYFTVGEHRCVQPGSDSNQQDIRRWVELLHQTLVVP